MGNVIERIIARDKLERPVSPPARMPQLPSPQRAKPSCLIGHMPAICRRVDSSDEEKQHRPVLPPRRAHLKFEEEDYKQEYYEIKPTKRRKKVRRANLFIDAEAGVDGEASGDEVSDNENNDWNGYIVADVIEFLFIYYFFYLIYYFIALVYYNVHYCPQYKFCTHLFAQV